MLELLLRAQSRKALMRFKQTVTKQLVASNSTDSIASPRKMTKDSFTMMFYKFENQAFKDFAARHQVTYLSLNLHKFVDETTSACQGRLQGISNYLECFQRPNSNVPITKGDLINIMKQMIPAKWWRSIAMGPVVIPQLIK